MYFTEKFETLAEWRKVEELAAELNRVYLRADLTDRQLAEFDQAIRTVLEMRELVSTN